MDDERAELARKIELAMTRAGIAPPTGAASQLAELAVLVSGWNERMNLTGHHSPAEVAGRLVLDAVGIAAALPGFATLVDLGSGAGFPGLPIAILFPSRRVRLVDSRERRHYFQREAIRRLGLSNAVATRQRIEDPVVERCDGAIAQAVGQASDVLELMRPWARSGGWLAIPALPRAHAPTVPNALGDLERREYEVPALKEGDRAEPRVLWIVHLCN